MDSRVWLSGGRQSAAAVAHASGPYTAQIQGVACLLDLELRPDGHLSGTLILEGETLWLVGGIAGYVSGGYGFLLEPDTHEIIAIFQLPLEVNGFSLALDVPDFSERLTLHCSERITFERVASLENTPLAPSKKDPNPRSTF